MSKGSWSRVKDWETYRRTIGRIYRKGNGMKRKRNGNETGSEKPRNLLGKQANIPNPGSDEAIAAGCQCAVLDNHHGTGSDYGPGTFWMNAECPLHGSAMVARMLEAVQGKASQLRGRQSRPNTVQGCHKIRRD